MRWYFLGTWVVYSILFFYCVTEEMKKKEVLGHDNLRLLLVQRVFSTWWMYKRTVRVKFCCWGIEFYESRRDPHNRKIQQPHSTYTLETQEEASQDDWNFNFFSSFFFFRKKFTKGQKKQQNYIFFFNKTDKFSDKLN